MATSDEDGGREPRSPVGEAISRGENHATILPAMPVRDGADTLFVEPGLARAETDALRKNLRGCILAHARTRRRLADVEERIRGVRDGRGLLDPDMPVDEMRLRMGEMSAEEVLCVRAAIRWANSAVVRSLPGERGRSPEE